VSWKEEGGSKKGKEEGEKNWESQKRFPLHVRDEAVGNLRAVSFQ
jgi:hypothetical protein